MPQNNISERIVRRWWFPLALVVASLAILTAAPVLVSHRVREMRHNLTDVSDQARVVVNDLEEGLATERLISAMTPGEGRPATARPQVTRDLHQLDSLSRRIGTDAAVRVNTVAVLIERWRAQRDAGNARSDIALDNAMNAARQFEAYLDSVSAEQKEEIRQIEHVDVWLALFLAPLALASALLVFWVGRRAIQVAHEAETGRVALARALEGKASLMRGVTHDLKNPLGAAAGYAELLHDGIAGDLTQPQRDMVQRVHQLVDVALDTVEDLLNLSRAEARELDVTRTDVDVARLAADVGEDYDAAARTAGLSLNITIPPEPQIIATDPARVRHILGNLLSNALKYTPRDGRVGVQVTNDNHAVCIRVWDTGPGIPPEMRERIFDEFFRVSGSGSGGMGIGLAISRHVARVLDGDIAVDARPGGGSVFSLTLPKTNAA